MALVLLLDHLEVDLTQYTSRLIIEDIFGHIRKCLEQNKNDKHQVCL